MQTFVKMRPATRITYIGFSPAEGVEAKVNQNNFCMDIRIPTVKLADGTRKDSISVNQSFEVTLGNICPRRYTVLLVLPLELTNNVQGPVGPIMIEEGELVNITMNFKATRKVDLTDLPYFARIYLID